MSSRKEPIWQPIVAKINVVPLLGVWLRSVEGFITTTTRPLAIVVAECDQMWWCEEDDGLERLVFELMLEFEAFGTNGELCKGTSCDIAALERCFIGGWECC